MKTLFVSRDDLFESLQELPFEDVDTSHVAGSLRPIMEHPVVVFVDNAQEPPRKKFLKNVRVRRSS